MCCNLISFQFVCEWQVGGQGYGNWKVLERSSFVLKQSFIIDTANNSHTLQTNVKLNFAATFDQDGGGHTGL